jgi:3-hydroxybutyryl-CoA dehydrogenase
MQVYTLPESSPFNVLLTGDLDFVMEFAHRLRASNVPFHILPPMDEFDEIEYELELVAEEMNHGAVDPDVYGEFSAAVVGDVRSTAGTYSHIVDLGVAPVIERKSTLAVACSVNPAATVVVSTLTNTATEIGMLTGAASRVVGTGLAPSLITTATHIEIAGGLNATPDRLPHAQALLQHLGYATEVVEDRVALVQVRVLVTLINEAAFAVMEGVATPEDIDAAMRLGVNYPKGLLAWADEIGIPVVTIILDSLYREYQQERYRPCVLLKQYMRAGWHGVSSKRGFYTYD